MTDWLTVCLNDWHIAYRLKFYDIVSSLTAKEKNMKGAKKNVTKFQRTIKKNELWKEYTYVCINKKKVKKKVQIVL